jgi:hypothetical protein
VKHSYTLFLSFVVLSGCSTSCPSTTKSNAIKSQSGYIANTSQIEIKDVGRNDFVWLTAKSSSRNNFWVSRRIRGTFRLFWIGDTLWIHNNDIGTYVFVVKPSGIVAHSACKLKNPPLDPDLLDQLAFCDKGPKYDSPRVETETSDDSFFHEVG